MIHSRQYLLGILAADKSLYYNTGSREGLKLCFIKSRDLIVGSSFPKLLSPEYAKLWKEHRETITLVYGSSKHIYGYWIDDVEYFLKQNAVLA